jgi:hypothetical protein
MKKYNPIKHPYINNNYIGKGKHLNIYQYNPYAFPFPYHFDLPLNYDFPERDSILYENNRDNKEVFTNIDKKNNSNKYIILFVAIICLIVFKYLYKP